MSWCLKQGATGGLLASFDGLLSHLWAIIDEGEIEPLGELLAQALFFRSVDRYFLSCGLEIYSGRQRLVIEAGVIGVESRRHGSLRFGELLWRLVKVLGWPEYPLWDTGLAYPPLTTVHSMSS